MWPSIFTSPEIPYEFDSHFDLISSGVVDAVVVTLPRFLTYHVVQDCVDHGLWVFAEKPLCLNSDYAYPLIKSCLDNEVSIMTGYMREHDAAVQQLKRIIEAIDFDEIVSITAHSHMGHSYAEPFGDIKGKTRSSVVPKKQLLPCWLPEHHYFGFEQFLNVFSHITHLVEYLFDDRLKIRDAVTNENGEGSLLCTIQSKPVSLSLIRGYQYEWREGISLHTRHHSYNLKLPPAFLRNVPGTLYHVYGNESISTEVFEPKWSWSFLNQARAFHSFIANNSHETRYLQRALNQVEFAETLFKQYII